MKHAKKLKSLENDAEFESTREDDVSTLTGADDSDEWRADTAKLACRLETASLLTLLAG